MQTTFFVQDVYRITGIGAVPVGNVRKGTLKVGLKIKIGEKVITITRIEQHHETVQEAAEGANVGITLDNVDYELLKRLISEEIIFGDVRIETSVRPEPVKPKGVLASIKGLFKR